FHNILSCEERRVAAHRITEEALVIGETRSFALLRAWIGEAKLGGLPCHSFAGDFCACTKRNLHCGAHAETDVVSHLRWRLFEDDLGWILELHHHLCASRCE